MNRRLKMFLHFSIIFLLVKVYCLPFPQDFSQVQIETVKVTDAVYMLMGGGGNIGVSVGEDGILLIDSQIIQVAEKIKAAVSGIDGGPMRFVINTHFHFDHAGGNEPLQKDGAVIVGHMNVRKRMMQEWSHWLFDYKIPPFPENALPVVTFSDSITLHLNGDEIQAIHLENAHTDTDVVVYFREENVIHMGDINFAGGYPFIDVPHGGSTDGYIKALDKVIGMIDENTIVIPGHGPLSNRTELQAYRDMMSTIRDRIFGYVEEGKTVEEVLESKPTADFDERFSKQMPSETFVKIVFDDISKMDKR